jgi:N-methylhydantoinase A/oxoprolinase/acetone carboxylase beta subunit
LDAGGKVDGWVYNQAALCNNEKMRRKLGIGIDTGGTYTDAVIYDFTEKKVVAAAKALTTRHELSMGILEALARLPGNMLTQAEIVSLSTTLATNACIEDRGGRAKLIFLGGDERVINEFGPKYGLPPADEIYIQECFSTFSGPVEKEPDWDLFSKSIGEKFNNLDGAGIIETYAMKNSAVLEKKAKEIFQKKFSIPVACSHELFSDLNCLQRASTTLLNARLFPLIKEFLEAIKKSMLERQMHAQSIIVRSEGSLMSETLARLRPVETLLSGPAASISGGILLAGEKDCIIADMGGTTTDIALVKDGCPLMAEDGISVGKWKTFVRSFAIRTFGLGGDSAVHYNEAHLNRERFFLEEYRVVPLCVTGSKHPETVEGLRKLADSRTCHSFFLYEYFLLNTGIRDSAPYTDNEKRLCEALERGPLNLKDAANAMEASIYNFNPGRLLAEGIIQVSGFTPTDVMHINNDFSAYCKEASFQAARHIAFNLDIAVEELCSRVYDEVKRKLYVHISRMLLEYRDRYFSKRVSDKDSEYFINQSYKSAKEGKADKLLSLRLNTQFPLVGIGAPIRVFLDDVARLLGTRAISPEYYEVANALGAVAGKIRASCTVEIRPDYSISGITGYTVFGHNSNGKFKNLPEAKTFAAAEAEAHARSEAHKRGGLGNLEIAIEYREHNGSSKNGLIHLGTSVIAHAVAEAGADLHN